MSPSEIIKLSGAAVQEYIAAHQEEDETRLLLRHKEMFGLNFGLIANQISVRRKAESKLPLFYDTSGIIFPPSLNFEQSSSEATAKFKDEIILSSISGPRIRAADLTGGFGVDSYFLSKVFQQLDYVDPNGELLSLAEHNHRCLEVSSILYHQKTAEDFLKGLNENFDLMYLDPSRRDNKNKKVFRLADCVPDAVALLPEMLKKSELVLIKASPLLDIQNALGELSSVCKIVVVSVANECKELLFLVRRGFTDEPQIETYNLTRQGEVMDLFHFLHSEEKTAETIFGEPQQYLYEPNASILKSGAFRLVGSKFHLHKIHPNTHLYTSAERIENFPGRVFKINELIIDQKKIAHQKANVVTRNYPLSSEELKKKLKLTDGGENYVIGFSGMKKKYVVLAKRLE